MFFDEEIEKSTNFLKKGKILLYPTDTVWGLGCDIFNLKSIEKIYKIKNRNFSKSMIILVESMDRLYELVKDIPDIVIEILKNYHNKKKPITIVYENPRKIIYNCLKNNIDNTVAIRLTMDPFCTRLIHHLNRPIVSTSANLSGDTTPHSFSEINPDILNKIDYAVNFRRKEKAIYSNSSILKIVSNKVKIIRK
ncbi:L-threonylcarbamoyladenylate synthase [Blattabacterium cuenoti]|uniref:L-threonylcarbamoyladenylate synthase n=1 Tax=Blattabacterium cuenoti TaxID=1653831 RepID=UPI00163C918A|nr:L-threonylcarbamoyladenylate synthase [Blattabacterium cuenoti]